MAWTEVFPLDIVRKNALQIYQIEGTGWGNFDALASAHAIVSPRLATSLYGVAIDPDSDFDHVDIVPSVKQSASPPVPSTLNRDRLPVVRDSMLAGRLCFPRIKSYDGGFFFVCPSALTYGDLYTDTDGSLKPFGEALNTLVAGTFQSPTLRTISYIDALTVPPSLPKRSAKVYSKIAGHANAAVPFLVVPTYGRKIARITGLHTGAANPRVVTINGVGPLPNTAFPATFPNIAFPRTTMNLVPNVNQTTVLTDLVASFLVIKAAADVLATLRIVVQLQDD